MMKDDLGDRIKGYEERETSRTLMPYVPWIARVDGRSFSKFTKSFAKPYDANLQALLARTAVHLVAHTHARIAYQQSDEITLVYYSEKIESEMLFGGKVQKLASVLASMASSFFVQKLSQIYPEHAEKYPHFDCRVFSVPTKWEAVNCVLWRTKDCERNVVLGIALQQFGHKKCQGKNQKELLEMLEQEEHPLSIYPNQYKYGSFARRVERLVCEGDQSYTRHATHIFSLEGPFKDVSNKVGFIFDGEEPLKEQPINS